MKKRLLFSLTLLLLLLVVVASACTTSADPTDTTASADTPTEAPTAAPTETPTEGETDAPETEVFENGGMMAAEPVKGSAPLSKPYAEKITNTNGSASLDHAGITMNFDSLFYGHDSAINRDQARYAWSFVMIKLKQDLYKGEFFLGEFTGDRYQDMALYENGILTIYPAEVASKKTFEYNGVIYDSVYAGPDSNYSFGAPVTFSLSLPDATLRGTGDFDGNGYCDFLFQQADGTVVLGLVSEQGIAPTSVGTYHGDKASG